MKKIDWSLIDWSKQDSVLAQENGVSQPAISWQRKSRKMPKSPDHGKMFKLRNNLEGQRFGLLKAIRFSHSPHSHWVCQCECGGIKVIRADALINGATKSCGKNSCTKRKRTHCRQGHPFSGDNLKIVRSINGEVKRQCRTCINEMQRRRRAMQRSHKVISSHCASCGRFMQYILRGPRRQFCSKKCCKRQWTANNHDRVVMHARNHYRKHRSKILDRNHLYYAKNFKKCSERNKQYRLKNRKWYLDYYRNYAIKNADKLRHYSRLFYLKNRDQKLKYASEQRLLDVIFLREPYLKKLLSLKGKDLPESVIALKRREIQLTRLSTKLP